MRVRISYAEEVDDDFRRAIRLHYGRDGLASRAEIVEWFRTFGASMSQDLAVLVDSTPTRTEETDHA